MADTAMTELHRVIACNSDNLSFLARSLPSLVGVIVGGVVTGGVTYWVNSHLKKNDSVAQAQAARMSLCVALQADAELCYRLENDFTRSLPQIRIPHHLEASILTNRDLLLPVIQSRTIIAKNELSDSDIQMLVAALRALTSTIMRTETTEAAFQLPNDLEAARGACCVALETLGNKTQGFRMSDVPDYVCRLSLRKQNDN
jgi:hypothetical protein